MKLIPTLRDLLQPVNRLPPETISHIARYFTNNDTTGDVRSMIPLTHVCRYWRESIISTPENWTSISSKSKSLAELSLQRAKATDLDIRLNMAQINKSPGFSDLLAPYIQNTKTLRVHFGSTQEFARTLPDFPQSMPNLRSLSLIGKVCDWDWSTDAFGPLTTLAHLTLVYVPLWPSFLHLRTLTDLTLDYFRCNLHLDTLLYLLEENRSLERATLGMMFPGPSFRSSRRQVPIRNRLQSLTITFPSTMDAHALMSSLALQRGARLKITLCRAISGLNDVLPIISMAHLSNLQSPTLMECDPNRNTIRLLGPNGSFSFCATGLESLLAGFPPAHLTDVREFRHLGSGMVSYPLKPVAFVLALPALEALTIKCEHVLSPLFSTLFSNPSSSPSLKTLAFLDCTLGEDFMEELTQFASNRKNSTSAWLYRVVIINSQGSLPGIASIGALRKHVSVVDVQIGDKLPADLI